MHIRAAPALPVAAHIPHSARESEGPATRLSSIAPCQPPINAIPSTIMIFWGEVEGKLHKRLASFAMGVRADRSKHLSLLRQAPPPSASTSSSEGGDFFGDMFKE